MSAQERKKERGHRRQRKRAVCVYVWEQSETSVNLFSPKNGISMLSGIWQENGEFVSLTNQLETTS